MDAPALLARRRGGARGHHVLRRGGAAPPPLLRRAGAVEDRRGSPHGRLPGGHVRRRAARRLARDPLGRQADAAWPGWRCSASRASPSRSRGTSCCSTARASSRGSAGRACGPRAWPGSCPPRPSERRGELIGAALSAAIVGVLLGPVLGGAATVLSPEAVFSAVSVLAAGARRLGMVDAGCGARGEPRRPRDAAHAAAARRDGGLLAVHDPGAVRRRDRGPGAASDGRPRAPPEPPSGRCSSSARPSRRRSARSPGAGPTAPAGWRRSARASIGAAVMAVLLPLPGTAVLLAADAS